MDASAGGNRTPRSESAGGTFPAPRGYALSGKIMLSAIVILFSVVLFVLFLHLYARWYVLRRTASRGRRRRRPLVFAAEGPASSAAASRGLDPETLKHIPVHDFSIAASEAGELPAAATECAVCLNEFEDGEKVRTLPPCGHGFHVECIDMWFYSHATCPLCRSAVEAMAPPTPEEAAAPPPPPDLCSSCRHVEAGGSSSAVSVELSVEVPVRRGEGLYRGWDEEVSSPGGVLKSPGGRILSLKRLLSRDSRLYRGGGSSAVEPDLECGEGATGAVAVALNER